MKFIIRKAFLVLYFPLSLLVITARWLVDKDMSFAESWRLFWEEMT